VVSLPPYPLSGGVPSRARYGESLSFCRDAITLGELYPAISNVTFCGSGDAAHLVTIRVVLWRECRELLLLP